MHSNDLIIAWSYKICDSNSILFSYSLNGHGSECSWLIWDIYSNFFKLINLICLII